MQIKFQLATYDDELDKFDLDENIYFLDLNSEQEDTYNLLKNYVDFCMEHNCKNLFE